MRLEIQCRCGALQGEVDNTSARNARAICLCDDCQAFAHFLGQAKEALDANGGTDIYPLPPANIRFTKGFENLQCLRLGPQGMVRWYAGCCKTLIANTPASTKIPYVGLIHNILETKNDTAVLNKAFGPMKARIQGKFGIGPLPAGTLQTVSPGFLFRVIRFALLAKLRGLQWPSPFFDATGAPRVEPAVLSKEQRDRLRPLCGPKNQ